MKIWAVIAIVGALNYASRLSFIGFFANRSMPPLLVRALKFVPAAMLTALILPMIVVPEATGALAISPRVPAAALAAVVAYYTRSTLWTLAGGMFALYTLEWLMR
ncbi:MAG TPA: AzlD domain-containing protein [Casimicrobiaceae bacterium]|nr:AzlD domain-containing protein [Casimicrobiaceae bacterium]